MALASELFAVSDDDAVERLHREGLTDGLPVIVPTPERVERMLVGTTMDPDVILGVIGPLEGAATVRKVAINAVMAGCLPEHLPLVIAAVEAVSDARFGVGAVQATTHNCAPMLIVNGPARTANGPFASGTGALGHGNRANLSVGRALRLILINVGGGRPGLGDMAQLGHPGKIAYCLAEDEESNPWGALHTTLGFAAGDSTVTALAAEAPHSIRLRVQTRDDADRLLRVAGMALASVGSNNVQFGTGNVLVVLNPEHAAALADRSRLDVQEAIYEYAWQPTALLRELHGDTIALRGDRMRVVGEPEDILLMVAGGGGGYSAVIPTWGGGSSGSRAVTARVREYDICDFGGGSAAD
ncbi:MAG: hypothetical protein KF680_04250 [Cryobacterium sp.]|nr:hypothetical protein [Cryobacterium sp.]